VVRATIRLDAHYLAPALWCDGKSLLQMQQRILPLTVRQDRRGF